MLLLLRAQTRLPRGRDEGRKLTHAKIRINIAAATLKRSTARLNSGCRTRPGLLHDKQRFYSAANRAGALRNRE
jgi:hypothetical protein